MPHSVRWLTAALLLAAPLLAQAQTGSVGIGTTAPTQTLDVNGSLRVRGLTTPGVLTTDAAGNLGSQPAASLDATTAGNGLTETAAGQVQLGGPLSQATTVAQGSHDFSLTGASSPAQISQPTSDLYIGRGATSSIGQSFTLPAGATLTQIDVYGGTGTSTFQVFAGAPGASAALAALPVTYTGGLVSVVLPTPLAVGTAGTYSFSMGNNTGSFQASTANTYAGGTLYTGTTASAGRDLRFTVYYTAPRPVFYAAGAGSVGLGTDQPTATLDVVGSTCLRGLAGATAGRLVTAAADGTLGTTAAPDGTDFIQNQTATTQTGGFRLSGNGLLGGSLGLGTTTPRGRLDVDGPGDSYLVDDPNSGSGQSTFLPGHLYLAPYSGGSGTAYVQARVPTPTATTNIGLTLRTTNAGTLTDALILSPAGTAQRPATGDHDLLPVAYGAVGSAGNLLGGTDAYTVARLGPGQYRLTFAAASGLSAVNLASATFTATLYGSAPGLLTYTAGTGTFDVFTFNLTGTPTDRGFTFSVLRP